MISVNENERRTLLEWLGKGQFCQQVIDNALMAVHKQRSFDGLIHSSKLDWERAPEKQFKDHLDQGRFSGLPVLRQSRLGDLLHGELQLLFDIRFGEATAHKEFKMRIEPIRFQGTLDRLQMGTPVGNVLLEFKTIGSYERDKTGGDRLWNKIETHLIQYLKRNGTELNNKYHIFTDKDCEELRMRLMSRNKEVKADSGHLTQMWTYIWILYQFYNIRVDWAVLAYFRRDTLEVGEFVYYVPDHFDKINRAYQNFYGVYQWLMAYTAQSNGWNGATAST